MPRIAPEELGRLYREHAPALRLYARQWPAGGEDLVQDAFVALARQSPPPAAVLPWLYRVVRNGALAVTRSASRRRQREGRVSLPDSEEGWFASADDRVDGQEATRLLAELPLDQREVIVARIWGGLTFEELAGLTDCSLPTAHRRYQAGLTALRERLDRTWTPHPPAAKTT
ncbi:MAG TPA: sigma-70 family RNA polymerase sigma factor [Urbifossiella sp.]|jgi:RNA polymerase sigma-70 factor (ECF subfamily)|nr:sigma-70 family RNA polymerase sigma factor [Urbifossiella sp.]